MNVPRKRNNDDEQLEKGPVTRSKRLLVSRESNRNYDDGGHNLRVSCRQNQMVTKLTSAAQVLPNPGVSHNATDYYDMHNEEPSVAIILNHCKFNDTLQLEERKGSEFDKDTLERTFRSLGFKVRSYDDKRISDIKKILNSVAYDKKCNRKRDCLVVVVHTHGLDGDRIAARDCTYKVKELWEPFIGRNCPSLAGKPKLFFIQACRGHGTDQGVRGKKGGRDVGDSNNDDEVTVTVPSHANFLISYATFEGQRAYRNEDKGTWYIQTLCSKLIDHGRTMELTKVLTVMQKEVGQEYRTDEKPENVQAPCYVSSLTKEFVFP